MFISNKTAAAAVRLYKLIWNLSRRQFNSSALVRQKDFYAVLNLSQTASRRDIKLAYYKLSKEYHPDVNKEAGAEERFKEVQAAYQVLGDETLKLEYDESIRTGSSYQYPEAGTDGADSAERFRTAWKRRPTPGGAARAGGGPTFTGRTSAYDFDEYYRSHYGGKINRAGGARSAPGAMSEEDLKNYWKTREQSATNDTFNVVVYARRTVVVFVIFLSFYLSVRKLKHEEDENNLKTQRRQLMQSARPSS